MEPYDHKKIEKKWQDVWNESGIYHVKNSAEGKDGKPKENFYTLVEFTYPSGDLHVGHWYAFAVPDIFARYKRMQGYNVLYPMGFDAFGLPAENAAIKLGADPKTWTYNQMEKMRAQLRSMGAMFDWNREIVSCDPKYYKWTQWMFNQFLKNDLAYRAVTKVNWCPKDQTILANEQVVDGKCERCGTEVIQKDQEQWMLRITKYADRLIDDLDTLNWPHAIKEAQKNWIGRSEGSEISFSLNIKFEIKKYLIFDFDGVIGDTLQETLRAIVEMGQEKNIEDAYHKAVLPYLNKKPSHARGSHPDAIKKNDEWTLRFGEILQKMNPKIFADFVTEVVKISNTKIAIVSSGSNQYIHPMIDDIKKLGMHPTHVLTLEDHHSKEEKVETICKDWGVSEKDVYYFTDSKADIYELENICDKEKIIGCGWGHMGKVPLLELLPKNQILEKPEGVHNIFSKKIKVFTTRADTLFGVTYVVLAPEHKLVSPLLEHVSSKQEVLDYVSLTKKKLELERQQSKDKTGVELKGIKAINPANGEEVPVWIADYVLAGYGTGAVMAVPAHDERDFEFAKKYNLPIREVISNLWILNGEDAEQENVETINRKVVDAIIKDKEGNFYLVNENKRIHFVGGGIDEGEDELTALRREIIEETGFTDFEITKKTNPYLTVRGFRHGKNKNQRSIGCAYEVILSSLEKIDSEIEQGRHELVKLKKDEVLKNISWEHHKYLFERYLQGDAAFLEKGVLFNSGNFDGLDSEEAKKKITEFVGGKLVSTYRLRDWGISRQRYWGCPIPIVYDPQGVAHPVPDEHLPWILPTDVDHTPDGTSPLARSKELLERTEKIFGKGWRPEVETMDTFVDSSWYFYRYLDINNDKEFAAMDAMDAWMPVDLYMGGAEHTTMHLLYSRFWTKALYDMKLVKDSESYKVRRNRGLILGPDGNKMSKSKGNVINPDEIVELLGADTVRMYLSFMGPYGVTVNYPWDPNGVVGVRRFLERVWKLGQRIVNKENPLLPGEGGSRREPGEVLLHKTIKGITEDIEEFKFNISISKMMILVNAWEKELIISIEDYKILLKLLAPFAPHVAEELWSTLNEVSPPFRCPEGRSGTRSASDSLEEARGYLSIHLSEWPKYDPKLVIDETVTIGIQVNGKVRAQIELEKNEDEQSVREKVLAMNEVKKWLQPDGGKEIKKFIYVPGKIISIVV